MFERFNQNLKKIIQTARIDKVSLEVTLIEFLRNYRATPHSTTWVPLADQLLRNSNTSRLPKFVHFKTTDMDRKVKAQDAAKNAKYTDRNLRVREGQLKIGDHVLVKQPYINKTISCYDPVPFVVGAINGTLDRA